jgi:hypothetical protein
VPVLTYHARLGTQRGPSRQTLRVAQRDLVELQIAGGVRTGTIVATRQTARTDALNGVRADLLTALRAAGFDLAELPDDLAAALENACAELPMHDDPEAAHRADVRAWRRDRGVARGEGL